MTREMQEAIRLAGFDPEEVTTFEDPSYDRSMVGVTVDGRAVYDYERMVEELSERDGVSSEEAAEFIDYNAVRSLPYAGDRAPIVFHRF